MRTFSSILVPSLFVLGATLLTPASFSAQESSLDGTYHLVQSESDDIHQAIDRAVARMNFVTRPIARSRLRKTNPPYQTVHLSTTASQVTIRIDEREPLTTPANGTPIQWKQASGEVVDVSTEWENGTLEQTFVAKDGQRVNHFSLSPGGELLHLKVTLTSPRLAEPLIYTLRYRKQ